MLFIFAPVFFLDIEGFQATLPPPADNGLRPSVPDNAPMRPTNPQSPGNEPQEPPSNQPANVPGDENEERANEAN